MSFTDENHLSDRLFYDENTGASLQKLLQNISSLDQALELRALLEKSLNVVEQVMCVEASSLLLLNNSSSELFISEPFGPIHRKELSTPHETINGIESWVLERGTAYFTNDPFNDEHVEGDLTADFETRNLICAPLKNKSGEVFGVIEAINKENRRDFNERDLAVFEALANHVGTAIKRAQELESTRSKLKQVEVSLTEVHHRLKNNLSTITALIEMEMAEVEDPGAKQVLKKTIARIDTMAGVHNLLYNSDLGNEIDLGRYLKRLAGKICTLLKRPSENIQIEVNAESIRLDSERAITCGLLLNELLVNCYKHAFKERPEGGNVFIDLSLSDNNFITFKVSDDGVGVGDKFTFEDSDSIGGWLVNVLLRRLEAAIDITHSNGTTFIIRFKR